MRRRGLEEEAKKSEERERARGRKGSRSFAHPDFLMMKLQYNTQGRQGFFFFCSQLICSCISRKFKSNIKKSEYFAQSSSNIVKIFSKNTCIVVSEKERLL